MARLTMKLRFVAVIASLVTLAAMTSAFAPSKTLVSRPRQSIMTTRFPVATSTQLSERQWNFNEGRSPWGLKKNAEVWNGRAAQMGFVVVLLQELITGKGVIQGIKDGDPLNLAMLGITAVSLVGLTAWLAIQGDDDYVDVDLK